MGAPPGTAVIPPGSSSPSRLGTGQSERGRGTERKRGERKGTERAGEEKQQGEK